MFLCEDPSETRVIVKLAIKPSVPWSAFDYQALENEADIMHLLEDRASSHTVKALKYFPIKDPLFPIFWHGKPIIVDYRMLVLPYQRGGSLLHFIMKPKPPGFPIERINQFFTKKMIQSVLEMHQ